MTLDVSVHDAITTVRANGSRPRPTWHHAPVVDHFPLTDRYRYLRLEAPSIARSAAAGQFVMLTAAREDEGGPVLPRPMAIYRRDAEAGVIDIIYGVVGAGTRRLATFLPGERMLVVGPLGQGFQIEPRTKRMLLIGRGIGTCSLTTLAQDHAETGVEIIAVSSGRDDDSVIGGALYREYRAGAVYEVTDAAGSSSVDHLYARLTVDLDGDPPQQIMICGSHRLTELARALGERWQAGVQVSLEAHMACGLGYCHGCATGTRSGPEESPLICKDGPVFWLDRSSERS
ncbi:hypothetical protein ACIBO5_02685 [Nonomuraea angiospora]|uniref:iron-sulfur cluster-binding protein n=1 Tax=Nonomuraea angiospora TaxID=46172 RepID=UPI0029A0B7B7|nr:hypothetical protein [Nonomuraea angiospora]MDX3107930.1 hypothetical protein [Nonomuraea angiospora]